MSDKDIAQLKKVLKLQKPWEPVIVSDNLSWAEFSRLNLFLHEIPGIQPLVSVARNYPTDGSSSHVIGYVSAVSKTDLKKDKFIRDHAISFEPKEFRSIINKIKNAEIVLGNKEKFIQSSEKKNFKY